MLRRTVALQTRACVLGVGLGFLQGVHAQDQRVDYPYLGVQFTVPDGWRGSEQGDMYVMTSNRYPGLIAVMLNPATTLEALKTAADQGIHEEGTALSRSGEFYAVGQGALGAEFSGLLEWQSAKGDLVGVLNPFGQGLTVAAVTTESDYGPQQRKLASQLVESIAFAVPKESEKTKEWREWLRGKRLTYMYSNYSSGSNYYDASGQTYGSYSSVSTTTKIELCSDGAFYYQDSSQSSFDSVGGFGGFSADDTGSGQWHVRTLGNGEPLLTLTFNSGEVIEHDLAYTDGKTYLGERRYFVGNPDYCR